MDFLEKGPAHRCDAPGLKNDLNLFYRRAVEAHWPEALHVFWCWWRSQCLTESDERETVVSVAEAIGNCQVQEGAASDVAARFDLRGDLRRYADNIEIGAAYMRKMMDFWQWNRTDECRLTLAQVSYNAGAGNIERAQRIAIEQGQAHLCWSDIEPFLESVTGRHSTETRNYVPRIRQWHDRLGGRKF